MRTFAILVRIFAAIVYSEYGFRKGSCHICRSIRTVSVLTAGLHLVGNAVIE
jgi:hypothetical protein